MRGKNLQKVLHICLIMLIFTSMVQSKSLPALIKEETVSYVVDGVTFKGFVAYDENIKGKRPVVLVVHEWWGLNDYAKMRARNLAALGYFALAVDLFGNGKIAADPKEAMALTRPFYEDALMIKNLLDAAVRKTSEYPQADPENVGAVGYCFGGFVVLNYVKMGAHLKGVVSFHGGLGGVPFNRQLLKAKILVCHGDSDKVVSQHDVQTFRHKMDSIGADYTFKTYANATHAFTNPDATKIGLAFNMPVAYNAAADKASWEDMKVFFRRIFQH